LKEKAQLSSYAWVLVNAIDSKDDFEPNDLCTIHDTSNISILITVASETPARYISSELFATRQAALDRQIELAAENLAAGFTTFVESPPIATTQSKSARKRKHVKSR